jgi:hypothetical protein
MGCVTAPQEPNDLLALLEAGEQGNWEALSAKFRWNPKTDNLQWFAMRCSTGQLRVAAVFEPADYWGGDRLLSLRDELHSADHAYIGGLDEARWFQLDAQEP